MKFHTLLVAKIEDLSPVNQHLKKIGNQLSSSLKPHGATNYECTIASDHFSFSPKYEKNGWRNGLATPPQPNNPTPVDVGLVFKNATSRLPWASKKRELAVALGTWLSHCANRIATHKPGVYRGVFRFSDGNVYIITKGQCQGKSSIYWHMEKR